MKYRRSNPEPSSDGFGQLIEGAFQLLESAFEEDGWSVRREPTGGPPGYRADMVVDRKRRRYVVELRVARAARRPELPALLADALVRAQVGAAAHGGSPLGVIGAPAISDDWAAKLAEHAQLFFPGMAWGFVDGSGRLRLNGPGLEGMARVGVRRPRGKRAPEPRADVFSDLGQWMAKVLLAPELPERYLRAPRHAVSGPLQLAKLAAVSAPSASRFISRLRKLEFAQDSEAGLRLVRREKFLAEWARANRFVGVERGCRWLLPAPDPLERLSSAVQGRAASSAPVPGGRACLGLFAACQRMGLGFVKGAPLHLYLEAASDEALEALQLAPASPGERIDVFVREPMFPESLFRGAVDADAVAAADALQCWLDVAAHPVRGAEQADQIWKRVLAPGLLAGSSE